jgi:hypothetical protein
MLPGSSQQEQEQEQEQLQREEPPVLHPSIYSFHPQMVLKIQTSHLPFEFLSSAVAVVSHIAVLC